MTKRIFFAILAASLITLAVALGGGAAIALLPGRYIPLILALLAAVVIPVVLAGCLDLTIHSGLPSSHILPQQLHCALRHVHFYPM
jgi:hypothetical protein